MAGLVARFAREIRKTGSTETIRWSGSKRTDFQSSKIKQDRLMAHGKGGGIQ